MYFFNTSQILDRYSHPPLFQSFHSFEHASHVTQAVTKLLNRVVTPELADLDDMCYKRKEVDERLHEYTFGITSDPLTQFACIFSALIHDVDHLGVPNAALVSESNELAIKYKNKSVAEQNSVDLAWAMLEDPSYTDLRECIYTNQEELNRFRSLVVNSVMATDISDKELGAARKARWAKAFAQADGSIQNELYPESALDEKNRKATIVIEHLIQASDISHTMQVRFPSCFFSCPIYRLVSELTAFSSFNLSFSIGTCISNGTSINLLY